MDWRSSALSPRARGRRRPSLRREPDERSLDPCHAPVPGCGIVLADAKAPSSAWVELLRAISAVALLALLLATAPAGAADKPLIWRHAISLTGPPKYAPDFRRTDYVDPQAPKGGRLRIGALGTFDNFNPVISGVKGNLASHLMTIYEPLLAPALDEPTTEYGMLAEAVGAPEDHSAVAFRLRPEARWHDGRPVTAEDVVFSFNAWKTHSPQFNRYYQKVVSVEVVGPREVRFSFSEAGDPSLPLYVGQLMVLPKHWFEGTDAHGRKRDVATTTLEPPLGSGPYRLLQFVAGRSISYARVPDYWGAAVPLRVGTENLDRIDVEYYRDSNVVFEAFKADHIDFRRENSLKNWAVGYDTSAVREGRIVRENFPIARLGIAKAFVFNQRRVRLQDARVRRALALAYGFDDVNRQAFYGLLGRPDSYFPHTEFAAEGPATREEQSLFASLGFPEPAGLWTGHAKNAAVQANARARLREAMRLFSEAGYRLEGGRLLDAKGEQLTLELLLEDAAMERVAALYMAELEKLGVAVQFRLVDDVQYQNRLRSFDFDVVVHAWVQGHAPGNELREYFGAASAEKRGTNNMAGLTDPLVDALIERLVLAPSRAEKITAGRLLDRVLRAGAVGVLIGDEDKELTARWDRFGRPATMPAFGGAAFPSVWWWDEARAARTGGR
jgi:microcin C transport system substrate-binding protein